jgi:hypothetical protein
LGASIILITATGFFDDTVVPAAEQGIGGADIVVNE